MIPAGDTYLTMIPFIIVFFFLGDVFERPDRPYFSVYLIALLASAYILIASGHSGQSCLPGNLLSGCSIIGMYPAGIFVLFLLALFLDPANRGLPALAGMAIVIVSGFQNGFMGNTLSVAGIAGAVLLFPGRPVWSYRAWGLYILVLFLVLFSIGNLAQEGTLFFYRLNLILAIVVTEVLMNVLVHTSGRVRKVGEQWL